MIVEVLMSTYNGEQYIEQQLQSILTQSVDVHIVIRDDGSTDETLHILEHYPMVEVIRGDNVGPTKSFLSLLKAAPKSDYYAFADQDDVWDSDKLQVAVTELERFKERPAVYSGNRRLVDSGLRFITKETARPKTSLGSALVKNYATGCTMVFNNALMQYLKMGSLESAPFHDWWVNLVCLSVGGVSLFDYGSHMDYRQHGNNVVGGNSSFLSIWKTRFLKFRGDSYHRDRMAATLLNTYKDNITVQEREILVEFSEKKLLKLLWNKAFQTGDRTVDFLFKICVLFGRI